MMKRAMVFAVVCLWASCALGETITVGAAISLKDGLTKVAAEYKADTGEEVEFTFASSGQLASQVINGAPIDLFISAANKQVNDLVKAGAAEESTRKVIAGNAMVLVVPPEAKSPPGSIEGLAGKAVAKIAVGEPRTVPAGRYAEQVLEHAGIMERAREKLVLGMNVRQVLDYVERGEVSAGLVYATDAHIAGGKVRVMYTCRAGEHEAIVYPAVVVKASGKKGAASRFVDYVMSDKGQACLREFGFTAPPKSRDKPSQ